MTWEKTNESHYAMYKFIRNLHFSYAMSKGQVASFDDIGKWKNDFVLDSVGAPEEALRSRAKDVVFMFNRYIFDKWPVKYRGDANLELSIDKLSNGLVQPNSTVASLGSILSELYEFSDER